MTDCILSLFICSDDIVCLTSPIVFSVSSPEITQSISAKLYKGFSLYLGAVLLPISNIGEFLSFAFCIKYLFMTPS